MIQEQYATEEEREILISNHIMIGNKLVQESNIKSGNFLFFATSEMVNSNIIENKEVKIAESKTKLEEYLSTHPYLFLDGKYYTVTKDKQNLLANAISVYQIRLQTGDTTAKIEWNAMGEVCTERTIEEITALAIGISEYVTPLVKRQQEYEVQINLCATKDELDNVVIDYEAVI